jgi:myo-inositol-1(or 4)-monophosphatase
LSRRSPLVTVMVQAAYKAARGLVRDFGEVEQLQVSRKGPADFVSSADHRAEETLVEDLRRARPDFGFLLEEGGAVKGTDSSNRWIIDPLDGTTNFLHGVPHFAISIGLERDGKMFAGVIYDPLRDELFAAEAGGGAFLNSKRLRVSARTQMSEALIATGMPFKGRVSHPEYPAMLEAVTGQAAGVRRFGSAALDLAYVAAGRFDGFWEFALSPWDIAAGLVILREAGAMVSDVEGGETMMETGDILASNGRLHNDLRRLLAEGASGARK